MYGGTCRFLCPALRYSISASPWNYAHICLSANMNFPLLIYFIVVSLQCRSFFLFVRGVLKFFGILFRLCDLSCEEKRKEKKEKNYTFVEDFHNHGV